MTIRLRLATAALVVAATAACSSSTSKPAPAPVAAADTTSATAPAATTAAPAGPKLGTAQDFSYKGLTFSFTATDYKARPAGTNAEGLADGDRIATITVKACLTHPMSDGTKVGVSWKPWQLFFADGSSVPAMSEASQHDFPTPLYPNDLTKQVPTGECRTGLIPFGIPAAVTANPVKVVYDPGTGSQVQWGVQ